MGVDYKSLPFDEALSFLRQKVNLPSERWDAVWKGEHARAFVVAGAMRDELLSDLRNAVDDALAKGTTLETFRRRFDSIVAKHGWSYKGKRGWRTDVMLNTNIRTAYQAGRYQQMTSPTILKARPFWEYRHGGSAHPRPSHLAWDGLILKADDPWWSTHYPPNGWGCSCRVFALKERTVLERGGPSTPPTEGQYEWQDKAGRLHRIPKGIDPGWDYNVGEAAWGRPIQEQLMAAWKEGAEQRWEPLTTSTWAELGRPKSIPLDLEGERGPTVKNRRELLDALHKVLGGKERVYPLEINGRFVTSVLLDAESLAQHLDPARAPYVVYLDALLKQPFEVWMSFERHKKTGKVALRYRYIGGTATGRGKGLLLVVNAVKGHLEGWTFIPISNLKGLNKRRYGKLIYKR